MGNRSDTTACAPVAVIIVSWNCAGYLEPCLQSLRELRRRAAEVVVVDNASTDGSADLVRRTFPEVRLIASDENLGFCRATNLGIRATSAPFVLALNPDTRLNPDFLEPLLTAFEDDRVGIASGKLLRFDGVTLDSCGQRLARSRQPVDRGYGLRDTGQYSRDEEVFGACGAAALYRRAMLASVALADGSYFDERFFAFYEDLDLAWRARRRRWRAVYRPRAVGYHARGGTSSAAGSRRRLAAVLRRDANVRFHVVKNRYLTILRNDTLGAYLRDLPFIWARDCATLLLLLFRSPTVLRRLWQEREIFRQAWRQRRLDAAENLDEVDSGVSEKQSARRGPSTSGSRADESE